MVVMWKDGQYYYSTRVLKSIAENYLTLDDGLPLSWRVEIYNPWAIAEFRADFDMALRGIGRGKWTGAVQDFKYYRNFGRLQRIIIADILKIDDRELTRLRFYDIPRLRGYAYYLMRCFLNGGHNGTKPENNTH